MEKKRIMKIQDMILVIQSIKRKETNRMTFTERVDGGTTFLSAVSKCRTGMENLFN
ncbi:MAG: hypothetical protein HFH73_12960 [Lachnospiraceae bacterium]|jgi:hypothetical protein|nr:hypothetical protein [Lachnospiraceae bacterium]